MSTLSREARVRAELATRDAVFGLAPRLADLFGGIRGARIALRARFRAQPIDSTEARSVRKERDAERLFGALGYRSVQETATGGSLRRCGWDDEKWTY